MSLDLPVGAVIKQINAVYQGQPIVSIRERDFADGCDHRRVHGSLIDDCVARRARSHHRVAIDPPLTIKPACSYQLRFFCTAGTSIMGATVGYSPASFSAITPKRVLDTRTGVGGKTGKVQPGEEVTVDLSGATPFGSAAVINLTADQPQGTGFLTVFSADLTNPGTSNLNYSTATPNIANGAIVTMGAGNKIKIAAGVAATHVIVDVVGYLL